MVDSNNGEDKMTEKIIYWSTLVASSFALLLFVVSFTMVSGNRDVQTQIAKKQGIINLARNVVPLNQQLSQALYQASLKKKDKAIQDLLVSQGFTLPEKKAAKAKK